MQLKLSETSSLARLVLFIVCVAIAGGVLARTHYAAVDLPAQKNLTPPENGGLNIKAGCDICTSNCMFVNDKYNCLQECELIC